MLMLITATVSCRPVIVARIWSWPSCTRVSVVSSGLYEDVVSDSALIGVAPFSASLGAWLPSLSFVFSCSFSEEDSLDSSFFSSRLGASVTVKVSLEPLGDYYLRPSAVTICGAVTPAQQQALAQWLQEDLALTGGQVTWEE